MLYYQKLGLGEASATAAVEAFVYLCAAPDWEEDAN